MSTTAPAGAPPARPPFPPPHTAPVIAVIGNPNTGKSTLFNALTGLRQKTANYPGVTVERHTGSIELGGREVSLVDLPGTYSLAAQSPDEMIAIDVLLGHVEDLAPPRVILVVVDATNLRRNLFLATQLAETRPAARLALNMLDVAAANGVQIDAARLADAPGRSRGPGGGDHRLRACHELRAALADACGSRRGNRASWCCRGAPGCARPVSDA